MNINGYTLKAELKNANSGFSKWGFAYKNGKEYFIKELISPVFPLNPEAMTREAFESGRRFCFEYEAKFKDFFERINNVSRGNLVRIVDFFRCESRYYLVSEKVTGESVSMEVIANSDERKKRLLLKTVAQCFCDLHSAGIVHFDVKPNNIMIKRTKRGNLVGKIIDFDSGFIKGTPMEKSELGGDLTYLAPETFLAIYGEDVIPDEKSDIFALGMVFHQYYSGLLPSYNESEYEYPFEAVLNGEELKIESNLPEDIKALISSMLDADPSKRPSAKEIADLFSFEESESFEPIKRISVFYGGYYGKSVIIEKDKIKYKNTLHPAKAYETSRFPSYYSEQKEMALSEDEFYKITDELAKEGMFDIIAPRIERPVIPDLPNNILRVFFESGEIMEYQTYESPNEKFVNITNKITPYCDFVNIDSSWLSYVTTPSYEPPSKPAAATYAKPDESGNWLKRAGDL